MLVNVLITILLFSFSLFSNYPDGNRNGNLSLIHLESSSNAIIDGCVNAITGEFFQTSTDIQIAGIEPLCLERYLSDKISFTYSNHRWENFGFNFASKLNASGGVYVIDSNGGTLDMQWHHKNGDRIEYHLNPNFVKFGVTNFSGEIIGRKNHSRFITASVNKKQTHASVKYPNGTKRTYDKIKLKNNDALLPTKEIYPSGAFHRYEYQDEYGISKVTLNTRNGEYLGSIKFVYPSKKELKNKPYFDAIASNGQTVRYHLTPEKKRVCFNITRVEKSHAPDETIKIKYKGDCKQKIRVRKPESRYRDACLYYYGWQQTRQGPVQIKENQGNAKNAQMWVGKVHQLKAPVGHDDTAITTHEFSYWTPLFHEVDTNIIRSGLGSTTVYDAFSHKTCYHWNDSFQLNKIEKFSGTVNHTLYSTEHFRYDKTGQLTQRFYDKTNEGILFCREFAYDGDGNVIHDTLWGNLTGREVCKMVQRSCGSPVANGVDTYTKSYRYTTDSSRNIAYESDGFTETFFEYQPNTDLLTAKFMGGLGKIEVREFYHYSDRGELVCKISDDGCSRDQHNLDGVTLRRFERKEFVGGFPVRIDELYYDFASGQEVLNSRQRIQYSATGKPLEDQHYDSNGTHLYTLYMQYDAHDNVVFATDALGIPTVFTYDQNDNLISQIREGIVKRNTYDFVNRLIKEEIVGNDGSSQVQSYRYNHLSQKIGATDQWGNETTFQYDDFGRPIADHKPSYLGEDSTVISPVIRRTYDATGNVTTLVTPSGYELHSAYTLRGDLIRSWDHEGTLQRCEYSLDGKLLKRQERSGLESRYAYDFMGRVIREDLYDASGVHIRTVSSAYKGSHKLYDCDSAGVITNFVYNFRGQCISKETAGAVTTFEYDSQGRIVREEQLDTSKTTAYDHFNRVVEEWVDGVVSKKRYDEHGRIVWEQAGESEITTKYNALGLPIEVTDAEGRTVYTSYNDNFVNTLGQRVRVVTHTQPNGTLTVIEYNSHGIVVRQSTLSPLGELLQNAVHTHEANGKLVETVTTVISPNKPSYERKMCLQYDPQGRLICLRDAAGSLEQKTTLYFYNNLGQKICEKQANDIAIHYTYDVLGRVSSQRTSDESVGYTYSYDNRDNLILVTDSVHNCTTEKSYDQLNQLIHEKLANNLSLSYSYDTLGRLTTMTLPDESLVTYTYQGTFLKTVSKDHFTHTYEERNLSGKCVLESTSFGDVRTTNYSLTGQKLEIQAPGFRDQVLARDLSGNVITRKIQEREQTFQWDLLQQLKQENSLSYVHDSIYNRTKLGGSDYTLNKLNQVLHDGENAYRYDTNGNLIEGRGMTFEYDGLNRLVVANTSTGTVRYRYDAENRRVSSIGAETTHYYYFGMNELGSISPSTTSMRVFGQSEGAERGAGVLFVLDGTMYVPLYDILGNVAGLRDIDGSIVEEYSYDLFGVEGIENPVKSPWKYSSKRLDSETGFLYFGHRYYDTVLGRWATADPKGYAEGPNLYAFVMNNPIAHMDQYGLEADDAKAGGVTEAKPKRKSIRIGKKLLLLGGLRRTFLNFPKLRGMIKFTTEDIGSKLNTKLREPEANEVLLYSLGKDKEPKAYFIGFVNGIMNTLEEAGGSAESVSQLHNEMNVYTLHNPTKGFFKDLAEVVMLKLGYYSDTCKKVEGEMRQLFGMFPDKYCVAYAHSKGAIILDRVLKRLPDEMRRRIFASTFGGAQIIDPKGLAGAINIISYRDVVPYVACGWDLMCHAFNKKDYIKMVPGNGMYGFDHPFASPTYQKALKFTAKQFDNPMSVR